MRRQNVLKMKTEKGSHNDSNSKQQREDQIYNNFGLDSPGEQHFGKLYRLR
jgi:hypothetical protein